MQDFLLAIIAAALVILTAELSIVFYYIIIFLRETVIIARKAKDLEGDLEKKINNLEGEFTLFSARVVKSLFKKANKIFKK